LGFCQQEFTLTPITQFDFAPTLLDVVKECTESYDEDQPGASWPSNLLHRQTVVYGSGVIAVAGTPVRHHVDPEELSLCRELAAQSREIIGGIEIGMGSEGGAGFSPFFICVNSDEAVPGAITGELIRKRFGGTIFPPAGITVEPLVESGLWWREVTAGVEGLDETERSEILAAWRRLISWYETHPRLSGGSFVRIGDYDELRRVKATELPEGTNTFGSVLPRLAVGLSRQGSLIGIFGSVVQT